MHYGRAGYVRPPALRQQWGRSPCKPRQEGEQAMLRQAHSVLQRPPFGPTRGQSHPPWRRPCSPDGRRAAEYRSLRRLESQRKVGSGRKSPQRHDAAKRGRYVAQLLLRSLLHLNNVQLALMSVEKASEHLDNESGVGVCWVRHQSSSR
jgi:hypothetical protein